MSSERHLHPSENEQAWHNIFMAVYAQLLPNPYPRLENETPKEQSSTDNMVRSDISPPDSRPTNL